MVSPNPNSNFLVRAVGHLQANPDPSPGPNPPNPDPGPTPDPHPESNPIPNPNPDPGPKQVRIVENLEAARKVSHAAVMRVKRSSTGKRFSLPSGHEWHELESGKRVVLVTREDEPFTPTPTPTPNPNPNPNSDPDPCP